MPQAGNGFTLVEVLVALFVLAVGVLGAVACAGGTMRLRQQAALESEAVQLAASLGERMRVNAVSMALPDSANPYLGFDYDAGDGDVAAEPPVLCHGGTDCAPAQLAAFDLHDTARRVREAFPGGRVLVCRDSTAWDAARGVLDWRCSGEAAAPVVVKLGWRLPAGSITGTAGEAADALPFVALAVAP